LYENNRIRSSTGLAVSALIDIHYALFQIVSVYNTIISCKQAERSFTDKPCIVQFYGNGRIVYMLIRAENEIKGRKLSKL